MSEVVNATVVSAATTTATTAATATTETATKTTTTATTTMITTLERRDKPETPLPPPPPPPLPAHNHHHHHHPPHPHRGAAKGGRKTRKYVHTSEGTFLWIDGRKIRSALTHRKWPPRPRRVSFPTNDGDLVTGYLEPANPWEHAENVNVGDLISAYKTSCERHGTEPLQNVVAQLEKLDFSDDERCPELCMKHEVLEHHRCEPLEEIFKRVQFEKLDLEATSLDDESAVILFDMLEYYQSAKHLNMSSNRDIGSRGWQACAHMIKKTTCLEILEARDIVLTQQHMNILKRPLQLISHLHVLKLENCGLAGRAFVILVSALKMNTGVKELYLADNGLEQEDAIQLGALLRVNNHLQLLDISNNHIQDEGVRDILDGLITQSSDDRDGKGLSILVLWNNALTKSSSSHFREAIAQSITLETLNIGKNFVSNELLEIAQDALIKSRSLLQLGMQSTELTCKGALALAEIIERNRTLQRIDLRDNNIQMTGLAALSFAMKKNTSITQLDLDDKPWSKTPATMHQYLDLVAEIRGCCARNEEPTSTDESTEESSSSPQHRSRLSSVSSRKISLTCQTLPRSPPSMTTPTASEIASRSMLEPKRTSGGRLRSPAPSPIPSPVASPIPSPSRSRFVVSRVSEASLSSTNSSASSSPVTPPSLASSPTCFFPSSSGGAGSRSSSSNSVGSSRFRVVTVVEPASNVPAAKSVVTSANTNVTIGFNYTVHTPESSGADSDDSDSVFRSDVEEDHRATSGGGGGGNESSASIDIDVSYEEEVKSTSLVKTAKPDGSVADVTVETTETTVIKTKETREIPAESLEAPKIEDNQTDGAARGSRSEAPTESTLNLVETTVERSVEISAATKESEEPVTAEMTRVIHRADSEVIETKASAETRAEETTRRDEIIASYQPPETKKPEPVQRQATSLERLLGLFQHPSSLFSGSSFTERTEAKNPLQDGVNSMIALGDKFQKIIREGRMSSSNKSGTEDSPSHAPLQRSVSDASRSTIKLDPVKSLSIPQLSSIQATCTRDFAASEEVVAKLLEAPTGNDEWVKSSDVAAGGDPATRTIFVVEESSGGPVDMCTKSEKDDEDDDDDEVPRISSDDLPLPETSQPGANEPKKEEGVDSGEKVASTETIIAPLRGDEPVDTVNSASSLNVATESKATMCAPKLKDIPEYSVLEIRTSSAVTDGDARSVEHSLRNDDDDGGDGGDDEKAAANDKSADENDVKTKCDSSTTDSINDPSCKNSSLCKVTCDISGAINVHTLGSSKDDENNFFNSPLSHDGETKTMLDDAPEECAVISVSTSVADDPPTAVAAEAVEVIRNIEDNAETPPERPSDSTKSSLVADATRLVDVILQQVREMKEIKEVEDVEEVGKVEDVKDEQPDRTADTPEQKEIIVTNNVDLSLPVSTNPCTNNRTEAADGDGNDGNQNQRVAVDKFDDLAINARDCELSDTVEEFLPPLNMATAAAAASLAVLANNYINNNSHALDSVTVAKLELDIIAATNEARDDKNSARLTAEEPSSAAAAAATAASSDRKIPAIDEIVAKEPIAMFEQFASMPSAICPTREDDATVTKIEIAAAEDEDFAAAAAAAIEQVSTSLSEDSDYSSKLSVDDVRPGDLSLCGSAANSPANDSSSSSSSVVGQIVAETTTIMNNSHECINIHGDEAKTSEHRSFVRVAVESVLTSILNVSTSATKVTAEVKSSESTEDLMFKMTDITSNDATVNFISDVTSSSNSSSSGIVTTVHECGDVENLAYYEPGQSSLSSSSRSPTNLYIEKSRNVHRNSQDSGIEETAVSISDDGGLLLEGVNQQPRECFQESVDSGIDSECSSVCARVDVGADVQKERARDPGKSLIVDVAVRDDGIIGFPAMSLVGKEAILAAETIATKIGTATYGNEVVVVGIDDDKSATAKLTERVATGRGNDASTDRPGVSVCSTSPERR